jgi:uncharacterized membrane protein YphA (DoxX/SURF4 family)
MPLLLIQLFISLFLAILFLQSGIDKITDWKGNLQFHTTHFANSPLARFTKPMLALIALMETACGALAAAGAIFLFVKNDCTLSFNAAALSGLIYLMLFAGQRLAKDYKGAAVLVPYFLVSLAGMYLMS